MDHALCCFVLMSLTLPFAVDAQQGSQLAPQTTLPVVFTRTVSAAKAHAGEPIEAKTFQVVRLADGTVIPSGSRVHGHVAEAAAFRFDKTPYARQGAGSLTVQFDSVEAHGASLPLKVTVRALAGVFASEDANKPLDSELDPDHTLTLVGGDLLVPSQHEVRNREEDTVGYNRRGGVSAHLIANGRCDAGSTEVSMGHFSASACGLYGFGDVAATEFGTAAQPSVLSLTSRRTSPTLWKNTTALLEVLPAEQATMPQTRTQNQAQPQTLAER